MVDKEAFGIIYAIKHFYQYCYGRKFTLFTDSKALTKIFSNNKSLPVFSALRMQHYSIFLQAYDYEIKYKKSAENANADCLSRLPVKNECNVDVVDVFYVENLETLPVTASEILKESLNDKKIKCVIKALEDGKSLSSKDVWNCNANDFFLEQGLLMRGCQVVIP